MADRAPTATRRSPRRSSRQASARSPSESALCSTATWSPKAPRSRLTVCGVRPISGTSTMAPAPRGQHPAHRLEVDQRLAAAGDAEEQRAVARARAARSRPAPPPGRAVSVVGRRHARASPRTDRARRSALSMRASPCRASARDAPPRVNPSWSDDVPHLGAAAELLQRLVEPALLGARGGTERPAPAAWAGRRRAPTTRSVPRAAPVSGGSTRSSTAPTRASRPSTSQSGRLSARARRATGASPPRSSSQSEHLAGEPAGLRGAPRRSTATTWDSPHIPPGSMALRVRPSGAP